jgi:hypothetical protein
MAAFDFAGDQTVRFWDARGDEGGRVFRGTPVRCLSIIGFYPGLGKRLCQEFGIDSSSMALNC